MPSCCRMTDCDCDADDSGFCRNPEHNAEAYAAETVAYLLNATGGTVAPFRHMLTDVGYFDLGTDTES